MMTGQTVFIIDDDDAVRDSIRELVDSVGLQASTYSSAADFLNNYDIDMSGCLVLDVRMAMMSGLELQKKLNEMNSILPIIFISGHGDIPMAVDAIKAGAFDFIQKPYREQSLLEIINSALQKEAEVRGELLANKNIENKLGSLTLREREVVDLLIEVNSTKKVAKALGISPRTVEVHRQNSLKKLAVSSVVELQNLIIKKTKTISDPE